MLEHSSMETIRMIQKAIYMDNWWLAASSQQHTAHASHLVQSFLVKHQITQVTRPPLLTRFGALRLQAFPKTKITLEREKISDHLWDWGNMTGQLMVIGRTVWGPKVPTLKGTEVSLSCVQCFLYLASSSVNLSLFHSTWLDTFSAGLRHTCTESLILSSERA